MLYGGILFSVAGVMVVIAMWVREFEEWVNGKRK